MLFHFSTLFRKPAIAALADSSRSVAGNASISSAPDFWKFLLINSSMQLRSVQISGVRLDRNVGVAGEGLLHGLAGRLVVLLHEVPAGLSKYRTGVEENEKRGGAEEFSHFRLYKYKSELCLALISRSSFEPRANERGLMNTTGNHAFLTNGEVQLLYLALLRLGKAVGALGKVAASFSRSSWRIIAFRWAFCFSLCDCRPIRHPVFLGGLPFADPAQLQLQLFPCSNGPRLAFKMSSFMHTFWNWIVFGTPSGSAFTLLSFFFLLSSWLARFCAGLLNPRQVRPRPFPSAPALGASKFSPDLVARRRSLPGKNSASLASYLLIMRLALGEGARLPRSSWTTEYLQRLRSVPRGWPGVRCPIRGSDRVVLLRSRARRLRESAGRQKTCIYGLYRGEKATLGIASESPSSSVATHASFLYVNMSLLLSTRKQQQQRSVTSHNMDTTRRARSEVQN